MMEISWRICKKHKKIKKGIDAWLDQDFQSLLALLLTTGKGIYYIDIVESDCSECEKEKGGEKEDVEHV